MTMKIHSFIDTGLTFIAVTKFDLTIEGCAMNHISTSRFSF